MAPRPWTTAEDRDLLLTVLEMSSISHGHIAKRWKEKYGNNGQEPRTERGIAQHIDKLKKQATDGGTTTPKSAVKKSFLASSPATFSPKTPKTPKSSAKKRKHTVVDSDDEEEVDIKDFSGDDKLVTSEALKSVAPRVKHECSSKKGKSYTMFGGADDFEENEENETLTADHGLPMARRLKFDFDNMSDGSDFHLAD